MKNTFFISFTLILFIYSNAYSQWNDGGTYIRTDDNVGIGLNANSQSLYVRKNQTGWQNAFINRGGPGANVYISHGAGYGMHIRGMTTDGKYTLDLYNKDQRTNIFYNNGNVGLGLVGNVGVGTASPGEKLDVKGNIRAATVNATDRKYKLGATQYLYGDNSSALYWNNNHSTVTQFIMRDKENVIYGRLYGSGNGANFGLLDGDGHWSYLASKDNYTAFRINNSEKMRILSNGNVGIGTSSPTNKLTVSGAARITGRTFIGNITNSGTLDYKLFVEKGILAEKVRVAVKNSSDWADYVFDQEYDLMSLSEVSKYIDENKHLPGVPSAEEVVESGINVAEMDAILLKKLEESYLYIMDLQQQMDSIKKELSNIKNIHQKN